MKYGIKRISRTGSLHHKIITIYLSELYLSCVQLTQF